MIPTLRAKLLALIFATVLFPRQAAATVVTQTFCFKYGTTGFTDRPTGDYLVGTYYVANGAKFSITRNSNSDTYDFVLGTDGCRTIDLENEAWTVKLFRTASVNNNTVEVRSPEGGMYVSLAHSSFVPVNASTTTWSNSGNVAMIMAVATYSIAAHNGGLSGETFSFRDSLDNCPETSIGCHDAVTDTIGIGSVLNDYKFGIAHELGHAMTYYANPLGVAKNCTKAINDCPSDVGSAHNMTSKEYQSCAAMEGAAHGYSALVFNDESESDCDMEKHYDIDWTGDGDGLDEGEFATFSCEGGTTLTDIDVPDEDFLAHACLGSGVTNNRGNEYDWCRAIWDFSSDDGMNFSTFLDIWDDANPHNWNAIGNGTGAGYPAHRMAIAAGAIGTTRRTKWDNNAADNGIDR